MFEVDHTEHTKTRLEFVRQHTWGEQSVFAGHDKVSVEIYISCDVVLETYDEAGNMIPRWREAIIAVMGTQEE